MPAAVCDDCGGTWPVRPDRPEQQPCPSCRAEVPTLDRLADSAGSYRAAINHAIGALRTGRTAEALAVLEAAVGTDRRLRLVPPTVRRQDRARLRRSLRRHLMAHHAHNEPDATARALALVQPAASAR